MISIEEILIDKIIKVGLQTNDINDYFQNYYYTINTYITEEACHEYINCNSKVYSYMIDYLYKIDNSYIGNSIVQVINDFRHNKTIELIKSNMHIKFSGHDTRWGRVTD